MIIQSIEINKNGGEFFFIIMYNVKIKNRILILIN